ncbi:hypothetical protein N9Z27_01830 [Alphaproteobacteria bacterium]|nr:hypothetical protein [Alphaproteobacteria bacterium]
MLSVSAHAQNSRPAANVSRPALVITQEPVPQKIRNGLYSKPEQTRDIFSSDVAGSAYYQPTQTLVTRKIEDIQADLGLLRNNVSTLSGSLSGLQRENETIAADYYASVATVNTQLQSGTTPGNPRLVRRLATAENNLETLNTNVGDLNQLAISAADTASKASFILESTRAAFGVSGAVEEDHKELARLEDQIANTIVVIDRILNSVNDDITRTNTYLASERQNLRTLAFAVTKGDLYGRSLSNIHFADGAMASGVQNIAYTSPAPQAQAAAPGLAGPIPLIKIRFDRPNVEFEEPLYVAVQQAIQRYPNAVFDLRAVHPSQGNAAEIAIESTRSRRNAEKVLRTLSQLGLEPARINLSYDQSPEAASSEVHLYIR